MIKNLGILLFITLLTFTAPSHAQSDRYAPLYTPEAKFEVMARRAEVLMPDNFRFDRFRILYSRTEQYDPIGDRTLKRLQDNAFIVQTENNTDRAKNALLAYQNIVNDHLANLRIIAQALSLSKEDPRFGNPEFYTWLRNGIIRNVMRSGNGKTLRDAYDIITLAEETVIFRQRRLTPLATQSAQEGTYYYNMHDVQDSQSGQTSTLFVNTSYAMRFLEKQSDTQKFTPLPRQ